ncbi:unnamed protein product [Caenorhabditis angaria]|uniref:B box-type domain-containing protein n=1 Tax=Caenorhabditis angaria TaxID=860376 RepID=A0A9P1N013_9PELO|nr:unnamed protein product [Caenorhabditis angaria]
MRKVERPTANGGGRHETTRNHSKTPSLNGNNDIRSGASSPMFGTEPLPEDDSSHCPYCHKDFRKPRVLDCLHSICEDCIIAQLDGRLQQKSAISEDNSRKNGSASNSLDCELESSKLTERPTPPGVIRCPICAQESHVGNDVRYVHAMLLDYVRVAELDSCPASKQDRRCKACKSEQQSVAVCKQCNSDLCSNCLTAHGVMRMFDGHYVTTYEELALRGSQPENRPVLCATHGLQTRYLCATCEGMACKQCLELEHVTHRVIEVTDLVIKAIYDDIGSNVESLEQKFQASMEEFSSLPEKTNNLMQQYESMKYRVESYFEEISKTLEELKMKKLVELEEARQKQEQAIDDLARKMTINESRIHDAIGFTRRLLTKSNGLEMVASRKKVIQQLGNLSHAIPSNGHQVELEYHPLGKKQMENCLSMLGGYVVGRVIQPTTKDVSPIGSEISNNRIIQQQPPSQTPPQQQQPQAQDNWGSAVFQTAVAPVAPPLALGAIGGERKKNQGLITNGNNMIPASGEMFGWPSATESPPPPIQPPQQQQQQTQPTNGILTTNGNGNGNTVAQQINSLPNVNTNALRPDILAMAAVARQNVDALNMTNLTNALTASGIGQQPTPNQLLMWPQLNETVANQNAAAILQNQLMTAALLSQNRSLINPATMLALQQQQQQQQVKRPIQTPTMEHLISLNMGTLPRNGTPHQNSSSLVDITNQSVQQVVSSGSQRVSELKVHSVFGTSQQGSSIRELHCPSGFCLSDNDDILIADTNNHRVVVCGPPHPWKIGRPGTDDGQLCFPRKVIALKGDAARYVVLDKGGDGKTRAQIFEGRGEFVKRINMHIIAPRGGIEVSAATATPNGQLLLVDSAGLVYLIDVDAQRVSFYFDASAQLGEASDVAMFESNIYITDFKHHCVQVFSIDGKFMRKMGEPSQTPYPIGIDVSKSGEVLVADTHGNHLHVVVFGADGHHQHSFTHNEFRLSRCVGLRIARSGHIVTLCKHNHTLFVFKPLVLPNGNPVPTPVSSTQQTTSQINPAILSKFP